jgi:hypothetical protein
MLPTVVHSVGSYLKTYNSCNHQNPSIIGVFINILSRRHGRITIVCILLNQPINQQPLDLVLIHALKHMHQFFYMLVLFCHSTTSFGSSPMSQFCLFIITSCYGELSVLPASGWLSRLLLFSLNNSVD